MYSRLHRISRKPSGSHDAPASNQFAPRPFVVQPQTEEVKPPQSQTADLQAKEEKSKEIASGFPDAAVFTRHVAPPKTPRVQMKLTIGQAGDKYEQEADRMAASVVQQINAPESQSVQREAVPEEEEVQAKSLSDTVQREGLPEEEEVQAKSLSDTVQREGLPEEEEVQAKSLSDTVQREGLPEEEEVQAKSLSDTVQREGLPEEEEVQAKSLSDTVQREGLPEEEEVQAKSLSDTVQREGLPEEEEVQAKSLSDTVQREGLPEEEEVQAKSMVQRLSSEGGTPATPDIEESIQGAKGSGQPLAENVRKPMEKAFGADFSGVKVHTDGKSDQLNQSIQARAFTTGQDLFFRGGEYNPGSKGGQELLAHELTHVVQQNGSAVQRAQPQKGKEE
ncbi:hypothetical protein NIES4074_47050 [Cylindrospermum sp. NIES-4074]|nr:hypothetical protein NIES4074_47050 [Cylindrospermum sp. NIES-4074]